MRRMLAAVIVGAFVVAPGAPAFAKEETVTGQIVDQTCLRKDKSNAGRDHQMAAEVKDCAVACAKKGAPMAVLTSDGKMYQITGELAANMNEKIVPHVAHTVEITGDVTSRDGKTMIAASNLKMISK